MSDTSAPALHPALEPFAFLLGTWRGAGEGSYPTIETFGYNEEITFGHVGKPFLAYNQKTRHAETGLPLHAEAGYWRPVTTPDGHGIELILAHPTGIAESFTGSFVPSETGGRMELRCPQVSLSPTAVKVDETTREFTIDGDVMRYDMSMAAVGLPLTHHLSAELRRV